MRRLGRAATAHAGGILVALGAFAGWACLVWAVAEFAGTVAWKVGAGILLLSLCGWRFLAVIAVDGLYVLSRDEPAKRGAK